MDNGVELQSYPMGDNRAFSPTDIEPGLPTESGATVRVPGAKPATAMSDATSIHSNISLDAK